MCGLATLLHGVRLQVRTGTGIEPPIAEISDWSQVTARFDLDFYAKPQGYFTDHGCAIVGSTTTQEPSAITPAPAIVAPSSAGSISSGFFGGPGAIGSAFVVT
jgi:hypothetical protein